MFDRFQFKLRKWQWQFDREPRFRRGLGVMLFIVFLLSVASYLGLHFAGQVIHEELTKKLLQITDQFGIKAEIGETDMGIFSIDLDHLTLVDGSNVLKLENIDFGWRLTMSGPQIDAIRVRSMKAEIDADIALSRLLSFLPILREQNDNESILGKRAARFLSQDARLSLVDGYWTVRYQNQELQIAGLAAEVSLMGARSLAFQASSIAIGGQKLFSKTSGKIALDENRDLQIQLSNALGDKLTIMADRYFSRLQVKGSLISTSRFLLLLNGLIPAQMNAQNVDFDLSVRKTGPEDYVGQIETRVGTLTVANEKITNLPFDLLDVAFKSRFEHLSSTNLIQFKDATLQVSPVEADDRKALRIPMNLSIQLADNYIPAAIDLGVKDLHLSCQKLLDVLPRDAIPVIKDFRYAGDITFDLAMTLDLKKHLLKDHSFKYKEFNCRSEKFTEPYSKKALESPLTVTRHPRSGESFEIVIGPENPQFATFDAISPYFIKALIASEDAAFYGHPGYDLSALEDAFERNVSDGEFAVGGSTITMQTIKNLYLGSQKNILRKVQEIFLAAHVESQISKNRILEIYSNLAEFGPNIFGIGEAAKVYFAKKPQGLTLKESVFLVSLLPSPVVRFRQYCGNRISFAYENLMEIILERMARLGRIDTATMTNVSAQSLRFNPDPEERERRCFRNPRNADGSSRSVESKNLEL